MLVVVYTATDLCKEVVWYPQVVLFVIVSGVFKKTCSKLENSVIMEVSLLYVLIKGSVIPYLILREKARNS